MKGKKVAELFLRDVAKHEMTVIHDDGLFRHVRFREPGTGVMGFDIITWPWALCYSGDMGTFVFRRLEDMFEFFRGHRPNLGYWAEKLEAVDRPDGFERFSPSKFRAAVSQRVRDFLADNPKVSASQLWADIQDGVFAFADDGKLRAFDAAASFSHESGLSLEDIWESDCDEYTFRFQWCCHALPWAIAKYDAARLVQP